MNKSTSAYDNASKACASTPVFIRRQYVDLLLQLLEVVVSLSLSIPPSSLLFGEAYSFFEGFWGGNS